MSIFWLAAGDSNGYQRGLVEGKKIGYIEGFDDALYKRKHRFYDEVVEEKRDEDFEFDPLNLEEWKGIGLATILLLCCLAIWIFI